MSSCCVRVGYGAVARIHERKLTQVGVCTAAVVESNPERRARAHADGFSVVDASRAVELRPTFWDICTSTDQHLDTMETILRMVPDANLLVEKPVCSPREVGRLLALVARSRGRIVVNENYHSSFVTRMVRRVVFERLGLRPLRLTVEMTKNRVPDFEAGRFIDADLMALGYEGPHLLAVAQQLGEGFLPSQAVRTRFSDLLLPDGKRLVGQRSATIEYRSRAGVEVELFTALDGAVKHRRPGLPLPFAPELIGDDATRHRIVIVDGIDRRGRPTSVIGFFEPVAGLERGRGIVATVRGDELVESLEVEDDNMGAHLRRAVEFFRAGGHNPGTALSAAHIATLLGRCTAAASIDHGRSRAGGYRSPRSRGVDATADKQGHRAFGDGAAGLLLRRAHRPDPHSRTGRQGRSDLGRLSQYRDGARRV
jgi:hypothetical protein